MDWPHAPVHRFLHVGAYMVTGSTYLKAHHLHTRERLTCFASRLLQYASEADSELHAWAVFSNHYHVVLVPHDGAARLRRLFSDLHEDSSKELNRDDHRPGRKVWFQFWDTALTYEKSYLARLNYVYANAVHHKLVQEAAAYPWCSASWFEKTAPVSFVRTVRSFKIDRVKVSDAFEPQVPAG